LSTSTGVDAAWKAAEEAEASVLAANDWGAAAVAAVAWDAVLARPDFMSLATAARAAAFARAGRAHLRSYETRFEREALEEALARCQEALTLGGNSTVLAECGLAGALLFGETGDRQSIDAVIDEVDRELARVGTDVRRDPRLVLAAARIGRMLGWATGDSDEYDDRAGVLEEFLTSEAEWELAAEEAPYLLESAQMQMEIFQLWGVRDGIEEAVARAQSAHFLTGGRVVEHAIAGREWGRALVLRYEAFGDRQDLEFASTLLDRVTAETSEGSPEHALAQSLLGRASLALYEETLDLADCERALALCDEASEALAGCGVVVAVPALLLCARARWLASAPANTREQTTDEVLVLLNEAMARTEGLSCVERYETLGVYADFCIDLYGLTGDDAALAEAGRVAQELFESEGSRISYKARALRVAASVTRLLVASSDPRGATIDEAVARAEQADELETSILNRTAETLIVLAETLADRFARTADPEDRERALVAALHAPNFGRGDYEAQVQGVLGRL
jgi:predicted RNase H-like HicB family nuclease